MNTPVHFTIVIPTWSGTPELIEMALNLARIVKPMCDELIITEDAGVYSRELQEVADLYLMHRNLGDVVNINLGLRVARGEFVCSLNSDVEIIRGNLRDLCIAGHVVCVDAGHGGHGGFTGGMYVVPRSVLVEYGYPDESKQYSWLSRGVGADMDYEPRIKSILHLSDKVTAHHRVGVSYSEQRRLVVEQYHRNLIDHPPREVDPARHFDRMFNDPVYREEHQHTIKDDSTL